MIANGGHTGAVHAILRLSGVNVPDDRGVIRVCGKRKCVNPGCVVIVPRNEANAGTRHILAKMRVAELNVGRDACWVSRDERYPQYRVGGRSRTAHRYAYEITHGAIPDGLQIDHLCRNNRCFNPWHLEAVTPQVNSLRSTNPAAINARKTHCLRGHPLSGDNVAMSKRGALSPVRRCRTCHREAERIRRESKR